MSFHGGSEKESGVRQLPSSLPLLSSLSYSLPTVASKQAGGAPPVVGFGRGSPHRRGWHRARRAGLGVLASVAMASDGSDSRRGGSSLWLDKSLFSLLEVFFLVGQSVFLILIGFNLLFVSVGPL